MSRQIRVDANGVGSNNMCAIAIVVYLIYDFHSVTSCLRAAASTVAWITCRIRSIGTALCFIKAGICRPPLTVCRYWCGRGEVSVRIDALPISVDTERAVWIKFPAVSETCIGSDCIIVSRCTLKHPCSFKGGDIQTANWCAPSFVAGRGTGSGSRDWSGGRS